MLETVLIKISTLSTGLPLMSMRAQSDSKPRCARRGRWLRDENDEHVFDGREKEGELKREWPTLPHQL